MKVVKDTPFEFSFFPWQVRPPRSGLVVVMKATFDLTPEGRCRLAAEQVPCGGDEHWDDDVENSLRRPTDHAVFKSKADCCLIGTCYPPGGKPVTATEVLFQVGSVRKRMAVIGERSFSSGRLLNGRIEGPRPFTSMPLRWELSSGGRGEPRNPVGRGRAPIDTPDGPRVYFPCIENPNALVRDPDERVVPWGAFPLAMHWQPRASRVGTYEQEYMDQRWPWLPRDLEWSFFNAVPDDQTIEGYWSGNEEIVLQNLHPEHPRIRCTLPGLAARCFLEMKDNSFQRIDMRLDTIVVDSDALHALLTWRGLCELETGSLPDDATKIFFCHEPATQDLTLEEYRARMDAKLQSEADEDKELEAEDPPDEPLDDDPDDEKESEIEPHAGLALLDALTQQIEIARVREPEKVPALQAVASDMKAGFESDSEDDPAPLPSVLRARMKQQGMEVPPELATVPDNEEPPESEEESEEILEESASLTADEVRARHARRESFAGLDLTGLELPGEDLSGADFTGAILSGVNFARCKLDGCVFDEANLSFANLMSASLENASLKAADLTSVVAHQSRWKKAVLDRAEMSESGLRGADFTEASLRKTELVDCRLDEAVFDKAVLDGADLTSAKCSNTRFVGASLVETWFEKAVAIKACFDDADLSLLRAAEGTNFSEASFRHAKANESKWERSILLRADFFHTALEAADFSSCDLRDARFDACSMRNARFLEARLIHARLYQCDAFESSFEGADLSFVDARKSNLFGAQFFRAKTEGLVTEFANIDRTLLQSNDAET